MEWLGHPTTCPLCGSWCSTRNSTKKQITQWSNSRARAPEAWFCSARNKPWHKEAVASLERLTYNMGSGPNGRTLLKQVVAGLTRAGVTQARERCERYIKRSPDFMHLICVRGLLGLK